MENLIAAPLIQNIKRSLFSAFTGNCFETAQVFYVAFLLKMPVVFSFLKADKSLLFELLVFCC